MKPMRILSLILVVLIILSSLLTVSGAEVELDDVGAEVQLASTGSELYGLCDDIQYGQILQCWCWSYNNIKALLPKIAAQGFTAIQTSPVQATKESTREYYSTFMNSSWVYYQPVAFNIETNSFNALGTKAEFKAMCKEAHKYGIKVIVDIIFNHMANDMSENTIHPWIPSDIRNNSSCWHDISKNIWNFDNRYDSTHYCLTGLPDLNTSNSTVQWHCKNLLKECIAAGADGFRFDAAKHIETPWDADGVKSDFWPNVLNSATNYAQETRGFTPYYYGEVLGSPGGGLSIEAYTQYMSVTDTGANDIRQAVIDGNASRAASSGISCGASASKTVQWTESHDTFKDNGTRFISDHNINKTWAVVGSRNQVCGLYLARPKNMDTTKLGDADVTSWSYPEVKAVNKFKNYFAGQSEYMASYGGVAYIERGTSGVVLVNTGGTYYNNMSVPAHRIASGTYKDVITGNTFTVSNGYISGDIGDTGIAVVYDIDSSGYLTKGSTTDFRLVGTFNDWDTSANVMVAKDTNIATTSVILDKGEYSFKIKGGDLWFSNSGTIKDTTGSSGWTMNPGVSDKCTFVASAYGKYTFSFNSVTQKLVVEYSKSTGSDVYLKGTFNDWDSSAQMVYNEGSNTVSTTLDIAAGSYSFKIHNHGIGSWYGNSSTIKDSTGSSGWTMKASVSDKCGLEATGGTYTFSFNLSTNKLTVVNNSAEVPTTVEKTTVTEETTEATTIVTEPDNASPYYLKGTFNNWESNDRMYTTDDDDVVSATVYLEAGNYEFKLFKDDTQVWYGNRGSFTDTCSDWTMVSGAGKCTITATGGTYTFNLTRSDKKLTVLYNPDEEEETTVVETTVPETTVAPDAGSRIFLRGDFNDWSSSTEMTFAENTDYVTATLELAEGKYGFKIQDKGSSKWYGNNGTISDSTGSTGWSMHQSEDDCTLKATGGTYTFIYDTEERRLTVNHIPVGADPDAPDDPALKDYKVTFVDYDGTVIDEQIVTGGTAAVAPEDPVREGTEKYYYVFTGWDTPFIAVTADITVTATYEKKIREFEVKFLDYDGTILNVQSVAYGESAEAPADPERKGDAQYSYSFAGWDKTFTNVTADLVVTATYTESINEYTVNVNKGKFRFSGAETVKYGEDYTFSVYPNSGYEIKMVTVEGTELYPNSRGVYTIKNITGDVNITVVVRDPLSENNFAGATITLSGKIAVNFHMTLSEEAAEDAQTKVVFTLPNGSKKSVYAKDATQMDNYYVFPCEIAAKEMASAIKAQIITSTDKSEVFEYSVKEYAEYIIESTDIEYEKAKPLVKAMINYGANAQVYFGYNTENLANDALSTEEKALADTDFSKYKYLLMGKEEGISYYGSLLSLESETAIKHYFYIEDEENIPEITVNGAKATARKKNGYYEVKISDIPSQALDGRIVVNVGGLTLDYNVFSYGYIVMKGTDTNLKNVIKALYAYNQATDAYVGAN